MQGIAPNSVSASEEAQAFQTAKILPLQLDRLAECGRIAVKQGIINLSDGAVGVVARASKASLRAQIWTEYSKAELLLKKPSSDLDPKTGMKLNIL